MEQIKRILNRIIDDLRKCGIAIIVIILYLFICSVIFGTVCPMVILTGFPCPGCGLTRAVVSILYGDFAAGFNYNPAAFFWIIYIVSFLCNRYIKGMKDTKKWMIYLGVISAITILIYLYRMIKIFPDSPPLIYYKNNVLLNILKKY